jgi:hypothetical protein
LTVAAAGAYGDDGLAGEFREASRAGRACVAGACASVPPPDCDDGRAGTADACTVGGDGTFRCEHACVDASACDHGDPCNGNEGCGGGGCMPGVPPAGALGAECGLATMERALAGAAEGEVVDRARRRINRLVARLRARLGAAALTTSTRRQRSLLRGSARKGQDLVRLLGRARAHDGITSAALAEILMGAALQTRDGIRVARASLGS